MCLGGVAVSRVGFYTSVRLITAVNAARSSWRVTNARWRWHYIFARDNRYLWAKIFNFLTNAIYIYIYNFYRNNSIHIFAHTFVIVSTVMCNDTFFKIVNVTKDFAASKILYTLNSFTFKMRFEIFKKLRKNFNLISINVSRF